MQSKDGEATMTKSNVDAFYGELGERIVRIRKQRNITQEQLSTALGLTRTSVTNIEKGRQKVLLHTCFAIATALSVDVAELLPAVSTRSSMIEKLEISTRENILKSFPELASSTKL
jgi:transcriptional regulator with XRE-family HTH domain